MTPITSAPDAVRLDAGGIGRALRETGSADVGRELREAVGRPIGVGALADTFLVDLSWDEPGRPERLVAKLPSRDETAASTAASIGAYEREARFYRELAPRTSLSLPGYFGTVPPDGLLLEDLSHLEPGDQLADLPLPTLRRLREQLVRLQAPFWESADLAGADWLHRRLGVPIPGIVERMERSWAATADDLAAGFDAEERAQIDRFVAAAGPWAQSLIGPFSLTHHDFRVDNVLLDPADPERVVVLDWQTVGWGVPMFDVAYLMATSVAPEVRRAVEREEVARHVADLAAAGVSWDEDAAWAAYRQAAFATLLMLVPPTASVKRSRRTDAMFRRLLRHGARMALDLGSDEFLPTTSSTAR